MDSDIKKIYKYKILQLYLKAYGYWRTNIFFLLDDYVIHAIL